MDHDLVGSQRAQQRFDDVERQADVVGDGTALVRAEDGQILADQLLDELLAQARFFDRRGRAGGEILVGKQ